MDKDTSEEFPAFNLSKQEHMDLTKNITLWIPEDHKTKYDQLQKLSKQAFCDHLRKLVLREIEKTYANVS